MSKPDKHDKIAGDALEDMITISGNLQRIMRNRELSVAEVSTIQRARNMLRDLAR